ncbi:hypothetical protein [Lacihabitans soyangensis]|uniref:hypothetical protein n=1 Tax=Lacihabitans soyangensis TaxID=869394 RepID=UPI0020CF252F|nr:hypothetical protein [Lacihabitans soyangensis]
MKKIQIEISEETHDGLLDEQFRRKKLKSSRTSLAEIAADLLESQVVAQKKASQS